MVAITDTLPYVQQVFSAPDLGYRGYGAYPGISEGAPLRPGAAFPPGYDATARLLSAGGQFRIMHTPGDSILANAPWAPHYVPAYDILYTVPAEQFADDNIAWHTLFHEGAHRLAPRATYWPMIERAAEETIADTAAYAAMRVVGLNDDMRRTANYRHTWLSRVDPRIMWPAQMPYQAAERAVIIANHYLQAIGST